MSQSQPTARALRGIGISCAVLALLVLAFELVPRAIEIDGLRAADLDPITENLKNARVGPHPYLAYAVRPGFTKAATPTDPTSISHNSLGFRGRETTWEKPEGVYRIVCLGGSSTYGFGPSSNEANWPERLEAHLNQAQPPLLERVEVINGGCQGYSTFEMSIQLALRCVDFRPDLVLVYEAINDMRCALYPSVNHDNTHWRANWPVQRKLPLEAALEQSITYLAWRRYLTDWWAEGQNLGSWVIVDFGKYAKLSGDDYAQPTDPELGYGNFRRNLVSIIGVAKAHGAEVMLVTQGTRMSDFEKAAKSAQLQREAFERMYGILGEIANERSVPYCDARSVLEAEASRQSAQAGKDSIFTNEVHMTDEGCDLLARTIATRIRELDLVR